MTTASTNENSYVATPAELTPVLSDKYALRLPHAAVCLVFVALFLYVNHLPLRHGQLWRHAGLGEWMLEHGQLPTADPLLPLADGMRMVPTSWLSQVTFAQVLAWGGAELLSTLLAVTVLATTVLWGRIWYLQTRAKGFAMLGVALVLALWWGQLGMLRPQTLGLFCLAVLIWLLMPARVWDGRLRADFDAVPQEEDFPRWRWFAIPALMSLWANLDGSFLIGMAVLVCLAIGRTGEVAWSARSLKAVVGDPSVRRWTWLTELSFAATLVHPLGLDLWREALRLDGNSFWQATGGWMPLQLTSYLGIGFVALWALYVVVLRKSRASVRPVDVLLLTISSVAVACNVALIVWFAPLALLLTMPHLGELADRRQPGVDPDESRSPEKQGAVGAMKFAYSLICLLLIWIGFALSPTSAPVLGSTPRDEVRLFGDSGVSAVGQFLAKQPSEQLVFAPNYWGDWLSSRRGGSARVVAHSDLGQLPQQVQRDYAGVFRGSGNWQRALDRYNVGTLVVDKQRQEQLLAAAVRDSSGWRLVFENDAAAVLVRKG